ncbi:hypothetical protein ATSB10_30900 [Dyella thiooxydans]|uniref:Uncharacterized protein n=1 Tax=Dyella thiooxydans TaxID=445710 RepID=A0A160N4A5_9GAMM|nr:hypothetical protein ATSB10_30900 [Dyella thiooxydans]
MGVRLPAKLWVECQGLLRRADRQGDPRRLPCAGGITLAEGLASRPRPPGMRRLHVRGN